MEDYWKNVHFLPFSGSFHLIKKFTKSKVDVTIEKKYIYKKCYKFSCLYKTSLFKNYIHICIPNKILCWINYVCLKQFSSEIINYIRVQRMFKKKHKFWNRAPIIRGNAWKRFAKLTTIFTISLWSLVGKLQCWS